MRLATVCGGGTLECPPGEATFKVTLIEPFSAIPTLAMLDPYDSPHPPTMITVSVGKIRARVKGQTSFVHENGEPILAVSGQQVIVEVTGTLNEGSTNELRRRLFR